MIAEIVINSTARELGKIFDYKISDEMVGTVTLGQMVTVPFGIGNKFVDGFIVGIKEKSEIKRNLKNIKAIKNDGYALQEDEMKLARWIANTYYCNLGCVLNLFFTAKTITLIIYKYFAIY